MSLKNREEINIFTASFLDVICCALGAVLLICFLLVIPQKSLRAQIEEAHQEIAKVSGQIEQKASEIGTLRIRNDEMRKHHEIESAQAKARIRGLEEEVRQHVAYEKAAKREIAQANARIEELQKDIQRHSSREEDANSEIAQARAQIDTLQDQVGRYSSSKDDAKKEIKRLEQIVEAERTRHEKMTREFEETAARQRVRIRNIAGLNGDFKHVAFIFDISGSMATGASGNMELRILELWQSYIRELDYERFTLITYSSDVNVWVDRRNRSHLKTDDMVDRACKFIGSLKASGVTNTIGALNMAINDIPGIDTIVLFTDGAPTRYVNGRPVMSSDGRSVSKSERDEAEAIKDVLELIKNSRSKENTVVINTIGIGHELYTKLYFSNFLRRLANKTGGEFIAR